MTVLFNYASEVEKRINKSNNRYSKCFKDFARAATNYEAACHELESNPRIKIDRQTSCLHKKVTALEELEKAIPEIRAHNAQSLVQDIADSLSKIEEIINNELTSVRKELKHAREIYNQSRPNSNAS